MQTVQLAADTYTTYRPEGLDLILTPGGAKLGKKATTKQHFVAEAEFQLKVGKVLEAESRGCILPLYSLRAQVWSQLRCALAAALLQKPVEIDIINSRGIISFYPSMFIYTFKK